MEKQTSFLFDYFSINYFKHLYCSDLIDIASPKVIPLPKI